ncbi:MAG: ComEC/Rec2 family competence protein [Candidatus Spechtbacterales bacterium]
MVIFLFLAFRATVALMVRAYLVVATCVGVLGGVAYASFFATPPLFISALFISAFVVLVGVPWYRPALLVAAALGFAALGMVLFQQATAPYEAMRHQPVERESSFTGTIVNYPDKRPDKTFLVVESVEWGRVRVTTDAYASYRMGEEVMVAGMLRTPENFDDFDYQGWLAKEGIQYVMSRPDIELTGRRHIGLETALADVRTRLTHGVETALLPPHSSLYAEMILGARGQIPSDRQEQLRQAGIVHLVAISGMHITILVGLLVGFALVVLGLWRGQASYAALAVVAAYVLLVGAPASAVRAGVMGAALIASERVGRPRSAWRLLLLAAAIMLVMNPLLLRHDVGFQLSFFAVAGILAFSEKIEGFLVRIPNLLGGRQALAMTLSAQAFTAPLIFYHFGTLSVSAPLANVLVAPLASWLLIAGGAAAVGGLAGSVVGAIAAFPALLMSEYMFFIANLLG